MSNKDQLLAALQQQVKDAQGSLELGKALATLRHNPDFKKLIADGYLKNEAVRLVHLKADPSMASAENQSSVVRDIDAIGALAQYFRTVEMMGLRAESSIAEAEEAITEIEQEG
jgi:hypothetical protein